MWYPNSRSVFCRKCYKKDRFVSRLWPEHCRCYRQRSYNLLKSTHWNFLQINATVVHKCMFSFISTNIQNFIRLFSAEKVMKAKHCMLIKGVVDSSNYLKISQDFCAWNHNKNLVKLIQTKITACVGGCGEMIHACYKAINAYICQEMKKKLVTDVVELAVGWRFFQDEPFVSSSQDVSQERIVMEVLCDYVTVQERRES